MDINLVSNRDGNFLLKQFGFLNGHILKSFDKRKKNRPSILNTELRGSEDLSFPLFVESVK